MATYNIMYGDDIGKNCTTLVSARKQAINIIANSRSWKHIASVGITKDGKVIGHVLPTNSIFYVYQALSVPGNPFRGYEPVTWINDQGASLTTAQTNFLYQQYGLDMRGILKNFLW